jgi:hypothetical protein
MFNLGKGRLIKTQGKSESIFISAKDGQCARNQVSSALLRAKHSLPAREQAVLRWQVIWGQVQSALQPSACVRECVHAISRTIAALRLPLRENTNLRSAQRLWI